MCSGFINAIDNSGLKTDPCGTSTLTGVHWDTFQLCLLIYQYITLIIIDKL